MLARVLFENVTDEIREAARIPEACRLSPETLRAAGEYGLREILGDSLRRRGLRHLERLQELLQEDLPWVNRRP